MLREGVGSCVNLPPQLVAISKRNVYGGALSKWENGENKCCDTRVHPSVASGHAPGYPACAGRRKALPNVALRA